MKGIGYGKVILFGEHFVVYGLPGIAGAVNMITECEYAENGNGIIANDLVTGELIRYGEQKDKRLNEVLEVILRETKVKEKNFRLKLTTNMSLKGGMGSSAALGVAITRCLDKKFLLKLGDEKVNDIAYKVEELFHGNPSGIDNTVSTYGGLLSFTRRKTKNTMEKIPIKEPLEIVLADTGIFHDTGEIVAQVKRQRDKEPGKYEKMFKNYLEVYENARKSIAKKDWNAMGKLMNKNHELLQEMNVSCAELDELVEVSNENGALGAKLTGAGIGGNIIALTPGKKLQEKVAKACEKKGYSAYRTRIGVK